MEDEIMQIQWLGHSAFKLTGDGTSVLIDPFLTGNPKFSGSFDEAIEGVGYVFLTHMHNDHFGDTIDILQKTGATLIAVVEIADYVETTLKGAKVVGMNMGGTFATPEGVTVSPVQAFHSSSLTMPDGSARYGGNPAGLIIGMGGHTIYHLGDTAIFSDMALIDEIYKPDIGIVPIGGHFTMDAKTAALAVNRFFNFKTVIPCHYMTFPVLAQSAEEFIAGVNKGIVVTPAPMETIEV